jgi:hypothetical protein
MKHGFMLGEALNRMVVFAVRAESNTIRQPTDGAARWTQPRREARGA